MVATKVPLSDFPLSVISLAELLREGRDGEEATFRDQSIADWCYELFAAIDRWTEVRSGHVEVVRGAGSCVRRRIAVRSRFS